MPSRNHGSVVRGHRQPQGSGSASTGSWGVWPGVVPPHGSAAGGWTQLGHCMPLCHGDTSDKGLQMADGVEEKWPGCPSPAASLPLRHSARVRPVSPWALCPRPRAALSVQSHSTAQAGPGGKEGHVSAAWGPLATQLTKAVAGGDPLHIPVTIGCPHL